MDGWGEGLGREAATVVEEMSLGEGLQQLQRKGAWGERLGKGAWGQGLQQLQGKGAWGKRLPQHQRREAGTRGCGTIRSREPGARGCDSRVVQAAQAKGCPL